MTRPVEVALMLMRMALALLDAAGEGVAAARLQGAIDSVEHDHAREPKANGEVYP